MKIYAGFMLAVAAIVIATGGCTQNISDATMVVEPEEDLYFVRGYRSDGDPCKLTGETSFTNQFLDDSADLVSCPVAYGGLANFVTMSGAVAIAEKDGFILFRVPRS